MMTTNLFAIANVKQLWAGGSFRILLTFFPNILGCWHPKLSNFEQFSQSGWVWHDFGGPLEFGGVWTPPPWYATEWMLLMMRWFTSTDLKRHSRSLKHQVIWTTWPVCQVKKILFKEIFKIILRLSWYLDVVCMWMWLVCVQTRTACTICMRWPTEHCLCYRYKSLCLIGCLITVLLQNIGMCVYQTTWHHNPEDRKFNIHWCNTLISHMSYICHTLHNERIK